MKYLGISESDCTGCAACINICDKNAIRMSVRNDGFKYPVIDKERCIGCKKCEKVCKMRKSMQKNLLNKSVIYALRSKNQEIRLHSTSGGAFSELAQFVIARGGYVVGAVYKTDWSVEHCMIQDIESLEKIRRSKYQQSDINYVYREIEDALKKGKEVLFCGTPCQVSGLKGFLGKIYESLYTCDFICRGVSSPRVFAKYLENLQNKYESEIVSVWMKNKCNGWHNLTTVIDFKNGKRYIKNGLEDTYVRLYLRYNAGVRESCYTCQFKGENDIADITLGDFWGLEGTEMDDDLGTSVAICRTEKGVLLMEEIRDQIIYKKMCLEDVRKGNPCLFYSIEKKIDDMDAFYKILEEYGYIQAIKWIEETLG